MIGRLTGTILEKQAPTLLIDVQGVAYEVFAPMNTFYHLPDINERATLHTHLIVREDAHTLYGFHSKQERSLFRGLIKVNGVGPKLALSILSGIEAQAFVNCVHQNDATTLVRIPGVGKKTAERLIIETRDKLKDWDIASPTSAASAPSQSSDDAIAALLALGYKQKEAEKSIKNVFEPDLTSEALIKLSLQQMINV